MHHEVGVGDAGVDFLHAADGQHIAGRRAREFVGAVAGADGDRQRVELGFLDETRGFFGIGQHLAMVELANRADAVFFAGLAGFERAQAAQLTFDRDADLVRHRDDLLGHIDVVAEIGRGLAVFLERAVHHDRAEAQADGAFANLGAGAVVLMHDQRNVRISLGGGQDQVLDERLARVFARPGAGLQDDRRTDLVGRLHHGLDLLEIVDVESRDSVAVFGCVVEQLAHRDERHSKVS